MAFSDFVYPGVISELGLTEASAVDLYGQVPPLPMSAVLAGSLPINVPLATSSTSEAARSTWLVGPLLSDLWARYRGQVSLFAGTEFAADPAGQLSGFCDFLIGRFPQVPNIRVPVVILFEAKRDSIFDGLGQCIAAMVGAERFNRNGGNPVDATYGCVTTGMTWKFLQLNGKTLTHDQTEYTIRDADKILGVLAHMVGPIPPASPAPATPTP